MVKNELPVLYVLDASIAVTGAFIAARNMARLLKDTVHTVLVLPEGSAIPANSLQDFWKVEFIPIVSLSKNLRSLLNYLPSLIVGTWKLEKLMWRDRSARLQLNDFYLMQGSLMRVLGFRGRIVSYVRCHPTRFAGPLAKPMLWFASRSSNRIVAVSQVIRNLLRTGDVLYDGYYGLTRGSRVWAAEDEKRFVYVGNYISGKGQDVALEAFAIIAAKDKTIALSFYGGDMGLSKNKTYRTNLEQRAAQLGLDRRVAFHDFMANSYTVLETAYAALNFSESESFSMTVLEASGAGVPVIATASGGPQEIINNGQTGHLIPVGDVEAAAEKMLLLVSQLQQTKVMGEAAAEQVRAKFSTQHSRAQLMELWCLHK